VLLAERKNRNRQVANRTGHAKSCADLLAGETAQKKGGSGWPAKAPGSELGRYQKRDSRLRVWLAIERVGIAMCYRFLFDT
jgi:hypothetical protein